MTWNDHMKMLNQDTPTLKSGKFPSKHLFWLFPHKHELSDHLFNSALTSSPFRESRRPVLRHFWCFDRNFTFSLFLDVSAGGVRPGRPRILAIPKDWTLQGSTRGERRRGCRNDGKTESEGRRKLSLVCDSVFLNGWHSWEIYWISISIMIQASRDHKNKIIKLDQLLCCMPWRSGEMFCACI